MKINDNGFSERIATPAPRTQSTGETSRGTSSVTAGRSGSSDNLQLSSIASRLQTASAPDTGHASRLSEIAKAVQSNSFQVRPMQISQAMVSEAVSGKAA